MGRHAGFLTTEATVLSQEVNFTLIPEVPFQLEGKGGFLAASERRIVQRGHAVIAVAEGAGQELLGNLGNERGASGNIRLGDIGLFLRGKIEEWFKARKIPFVMHYFDPSYIVRSSPDNAEDTVLCDAFARHAAHAGMAGKTAVVIGCLHDQFIHVPIELLATGRSGSILTAQPGAPCSRLPDNRIALNEPARFEPKNSPDVLGSFFERAQGTSGLFLLPRGIGFCLRPRCGARTPSGCSPTHLRYGGGRSRLGKTSFRAGFFAKNSWSMASSKMACQRSARA